MRTRSSTATTTDCSASVSSTCSPAATPRRQRRDHHRPEDAEGRLQRHAQRLLRRVPRRRGGTRTQHRQDPHWCRRPSYDPNKLASHDQDVREGAWARWNAADSVTNPMLNRAVNQLYPPGSIFKVITTAAALRQGIGPDVRLTAASHITLPDTATSLSNYGGQTCPDSSGGTVSLTQAFQYSCNTAFVQLTTEKMEDPTSPSPTPPPDSDSTNGPATSCSPSPRRRPAISPTSPHSASRPSGSATCG